MISKKRGERKEMQYIEKEEAKQTRSTSITDLLGALSNDRPGLSASQNLKRKNM